MNPECDWNGIEERHRLILADRTSAQEVNPNRIEFDAPHIAWLDPQGITRKRWSAGVRAAAIWCHIGGRHMWQYTIGHHTQIVHFGWKARGKHQAALLQRVQSIGQIGTCGAHFANIRQRQPWHLDLHGFRTITLRRRIGRRLNYHPRHDRFHFHVHVHQTWLVRFRIDGRVWGDARPQQAFMQIQREWIQPEQTVQVEIDLHRIDMNVRLRWWH